MKKFFLLATTTAMLLLSSCKKDKVDGPNPNPEPDPKPSPSEKILKKIKALQEAVFRVFVPED